MYIGNCYSNHEKEEFRRRMKEMKANVLFVSAIIPLNAFVISRVRWVGGKERVSFFLHFNSVVSDRTDGHSMLSKLQHLLEYGRICAHEVDWIHNLFIFWFPPYSINGITWLLLFLRLSFMNCLCEDDDKRVLADNIWSALTIYRIFLELTSLWAATYPQFSMKMTVWTRLTLRHIHLLGIWQEQSKNRCKSHKVWFNKEINVSVWAISRMGRSSYISSLLFSHTNWCPPN